MPTFNKNPNINILKEPRGFIKIIEVAIAIFAFSTTVGYHGHFEFYISCTENVTVHSSADFSYQFDTITYYFSSQLNTKPCSNVSSRTSRIQSLPLDYKSDSEYFVFVGVTCFLYAVVATLYYMFVENQEKDATSTDIGICSFVIVDFVITVVYVIFWFTASIAWAAGLHGLKGATSPGKTSLLYPACNNYNCNPSVGATYGALNVSVLLGFLNFLVWCFNIWFLFKETPWHSPRTSSNLPGTDPDVVTQETPPASAL